MSLRDRFETIHLISPEVAGWPAGTTVLVPPVAGQRVAVYSAIFGSTNNTQFYLADDQGMPISGVLFTLASMSTPVPQNDNTDPWWITNTHRGLSVIVQNGPLFGDIYYLHVPGSLIPGGPGEIVGP